MRDRLSVRLSTGRRRVTASRLAELFGNLVSQIFTSWNQMSSWLSQLQGLQRAA